MNLVLKSIKLNNPIAGAILLFASIISLLLWLFELRTRDIYRMYNKTGLKLERQAKISGSFTVSKPLIPKRFNFASHSKAIDLMFIVIFVSLFCSGYLLLIGSLKVMKVDNKFDIITGCDINNDLWLSISIPLTISIVLISIRWLCTGKNRPKRSRKKQPSPTT